MNRTGYVYGLVGGLIVCLLAVMVTGGFRRSPAVSTVPEPTGSETRMGGGSLPGAVKVVELSSSPAPTESQARSSARDEAPKAEARTERRTRRHRRRPRTTETEQVPERKPEDSAPASDAPRREIPTPDTDLSPEAPHDSSGVALRKTDPEGKEVGIPPNTADGMDSVSPKAEAPPSSGDAPRKRKERKEPAPAKAPDPATDHETTPPAPPADGEEIITSDTGG